MNKMRVEKSLYPNNKITVKKNVHEYIFSKTILDVPNIT